MNDPACAVCKGSGTIKPLDSDCPFCNGTGEFNKPAVSYMANHICQCASFDRNNCPLCGKKCHHNTPNRPKLLICP